MAEYALTSWQHMRAFVLWDLPDRTVKKTFKYATIRLVKIAHCASWKRVSQFAIVCRTSMEKSASTSMMNVKLDRGKIAYEM